MLKDQIMYARLLSLVLFVPSFVLAESSSLNLALPSMPQPYGSDTIRADDITCTHAIGGATNFELGMTGIVDNARMPFTSDDPINPTTKDIGIYARIIIPLDAPKERLNCNTLYQLQLRQKRLEVQKLQEELNQLRRLQKGFEN
jgi:hypothetical protein